MCRQGSQGWPHHPTPTPTPPHTPTPTPTYQQQPASSFSSADNSNRLLHQCLNVPRFFATAVYDIASIHHPRF